ncbi:acrylate utilization transcriptional regulator AcuR [Acerihabitans arboris]|uniref:TetR family transcriptional regulator n=1 Tax=Acerihabitans arboris TaxID=2691583 RepID=A0A845SJN0_9GAMM|nr:TetR/AcrR family transcriptional regulator [Acerihabitans arboris]NDL63467.1 TetR family transcriptional regulator [Acerihabitans arboris]
MTTPIFTARRGRPPKIARDHPDTRESLIRCGTAILTEQGFSASGIDGILKQVGVPKGSFYYYFASKEAFGQEIIAYYGRYFARKLDRCLLCETMPPLDRLRAFVRDASLGMAKYDFKRGCLVGNLGQEINLLPDGYRRQLSGILQEWQGRVACCLRLARDAGQLSPSADCEGLAEFFWIGWEGAVMRARLAKSAQPLQRFAEVFFAGLPR